MAIMHGWPKTQIEPLFLVEQKNKSVLTGELYVLTILFMVVERCLRWHGLLS